MKSDNSKHCHTRPVHTQCKHEASEIGGRRAAPRRDASFSYYSILLSFQTRCFKTKLFLSKALKKPSRVSHKNV